MKGKYLLIIALVAVMAVGLSVALADTHGPGYEKKEYHHKEYKTPDLKDKIFYKAHKMLKYEEELGLSSKQVDKIKDLKLETKKDLIKREAEIEVLALDIKAALYAERANVKVINSLIDKKYELKRDKAKALVATYLELKDVLTKAQKEKLKSLYKEHKCECKKEK